MTRKPSGKAATPLEYVLDANAVVRYFQLGAAGGGDKIRALLEQAQSGQARLWMSAVNLGEVYYVMLRFVGEEVAAENVRALRHGISIHEAGTEQAIEAASLKHRYKLAYADCFAASLALSKDATLVSADSSFEKLGKRLHWMRLPPYRP